MIWDAKNIAKLIALVANGLSYSQIGKQLGMSNMWSYPCVKRAKPVNGAILADCIGPLNESPWDGSHVLPGSSNVTAAPVGASDPVGGNY